jgi:hypothetical protein
MLAVANAEAIDLAIALRNTYALSSKTETLRRHTKSTEVSSKALPEEIGKEAQGRSTILGL